jgi:thiamine-monophosphate kinase
MAELNEFSLIERFFTRRAERDDVLLGVGDDAAVLRVPVGKDLVISLDTLNEFSHFRPEVDPADLGYKSLAVNLSDLAAMGAAPAWFTLALSVQRADARWLEGFSHGLYDAAAPYSMALVGGDTTRGPTSVTVQVAGYVEAQQYLTRSGAAAGDAIYVTGTLGDAGAGLALLAGERECEAAAREFLVGRHLRPSPRVKEALQLHNLASACIDISDGLVADLEHILTASGVAAEIHVESIPLSPALREATAALSEAHRYALTAGEDYELCICVPAERCRRFETVTAQWPVAVSRIGKITAGDQLRVVDSEGRVIPVAQHGFDHFA